MNINKPDQLSREAYKVYRKLKFNKAYRDKIYRQRYTKGYTVEFAKTLLQAQDLLRYEKENTRLCRIFNDIFNIKKENKNE